MKAAGAVECCHCLLCTAWCSDGLLRH